MVGEFASVSAEEAAGDDAFQVRVGRPVHFTHAASADERGDLIWAKPVPGDNVIPARMLRADQ